MSKTSRYLTLDWRRVQCPTIHRSHNNNGYFILVLVSMDVGVSWAFWLLLLGTACGVLTVYFGVAGSKLLWGDRFLVGRLLLLPTAVSAASDGGLFLLPVAEAVDDDDEEGDAAAFLLVGVEEEGAVLTEDMDTTLAAARGC